MKDFDKQVAAYIESIERFVDSNHLPRHWFKKPDHIAYKCADGEQYTQMIRQCEPQARQRTQIEMNKRKLGTVHLVGPLAVGRFGTVEWLEIMEPRPEKVGHDVVGIDHMEFYFPAFDSVRLELESKEIAFEDEHNPNHAWISIHTAEGHEFKINDKPLSKISESEIASGAAVILTAARMRTFRLNKIVRGRIPEIMRSQGQEVDLVKLTEDKKPAAYAAKVREEYEEFLQDPGLTEGVDTIEAIMGSLAHQGYTREQVLQFLQKRYQERGGFEDARFVRDVSVPEYSEMVEYYLNQPEKSPEIIE